MNDTHVTEWSRVLLCTVFGVLAVTLRPVFLLFCVPALLAVQLIFNREGRLLFTRGRFWILIISPVFIGLFLGERDGALWFFHYSQEGLQAGLHMSGRALCLVLAFGTLLARASTRRLIASFEKRHMAGLGLALGVAHNMLMTLSGMSRAVFCTIRLRGGFRRPLAGTRLFLIGVICAVLREGDEVVRAAHARGFDAMLDGHGKNPNLP